MGNISAVPPKAYLIEVGYARSGAIQTLHKLFASRESAEAYAASLKKLSFYRVVEVTVE